MRKKITAFSIIFILALAAIAAYVKVPGFQEKIIAIAEEDFEEENIYSNLESVSQRLQDEIMKGTDSFTIYLKDMDVNEISNINESIDGIFGSGESYQQVGEIGHAYKKVTISISKTDNYYAYAAFMQNASIPDDRQKAKELYAAICDIFDQVITEDMSDFQKELALHDYLVRHCVYSEEAVEDPESDIYRAYGALVQQDAVCNGYAEAMQILLMCAQVPVRFVIGTADGVDHAWNLVQLDEKWYHLDATWDDPKPDQGEQILHPYFNVTDDIMMVNHVWKQEDYPAATDMEYNYYKQTDTYFQDFTLYKDRAYTEMITNGQTYFEAVVENYDVEEDDMQFLFEGNYVYNSVSWQSFCDGTYRVLVLRGQS